MITGQAAAATRVRDSRLGKGADPAGPVSRDEKLSEHVANDNAKQGLDGIALNGLHRTAWAGVGDAVLFYDPEGRNVITEKRRYVFTEWDPTAASDLDAVRSVFDSNGDGKLTSADPAFAKFKL